MSDAMRDWLWKLGLAGRAGGRKIGRQGLFRHTLSGASAYNCGMKALQIRSAYQGHSDCLRCGIRDMMLFSALDEDDFARLHLPIDDLDIVPDTALYNQNDSARYLYSIRSGLFKLVHLNADGTQRILRVLRSGGLAGIEATIEPRYRHAVTALTPARVCRIPVDTVRQMMAQSGPLALKMQEKWGDALRDSEMWIAEMNTGAARQRVARLLLRMRDDGDPQATVLFKREDIGAMLDITLETASRVLSTLFREGVLQRPASASGQVRILDVAGLENLAEGG